MGDNWHDLAQQITVGAPAVNWNFILTRVAPAVIIAALLLMLWKNVLTRSIMLVIGTAFIAYWVFKGHR